MRHFGLGWNAGSSSCAFTARPRAVTAHDPGLRTSDRTTGHFRSITTPASAWPGPAGVAYRKRTLAEADRDQARFAAEAEAFSKRAIAEAEAEANKARAASLWEGNQELIAANRIVEILPALFEAAARGLAESNLTILNGTQGVNEIVVGLVGQGLSIFDTLKKAAPVTGNGASPARVSRAPGQPSIGAD